MPWRELTRMSSCKCFRSRIRQDWHSAHDFRHECLHLIRHVSSVGGYTSQNTDAGRSLSDGKLRGGCANVAKLAAQLGHRLWKLVVKPAVTAVSGNFGGNVLLEVVSGRHSVAVCMSAFDASSLTPLCLCTCSVLLERAAFVCALLPGCLMCSP
jgi:hypothetical protein